MGCLLVGMDRETMLSALTRKVGMELNFGYLVVGVSTTLVRSVKNNIFLCIYNCIEQLIAMKP